MASASSKKAIPSVKEHVLLLGLAGRNYQREIDILAKVGKRVSILHAMHEIFQHLKSEIPGAVLISSAFDGPGVKMAPDFIHRRYGVSVVIFSEHDERSGSSETNESRAPSSDVLFVESKNEAELIDSVNGIVGKPSDHRSKERKPVKRLSDLRQSMKNLKAKLTGLQNRLPGFGPKRSVFSLSVEHAAGEGNFILAVPAEIDGESVVSIEELSDILEKHLGSGHRLEFVASDVENDVFLKLQDRAEQVLLGQAGELEVFIAFLNGDEAMSETLEVERLETGVYLVPIENWWVTVPLPCDVRYWMSQNNRALLYIHSGKKLMAISHFRFKRVGLRKLAVEHSDFLRFQAYRRWARLIGESVEGAIFGVQAAA